MFKNINVNETYLFMFWSKLKLEKSFVMKMYSLHFQYTFTKSTRGEQLIGHLVLCIQKKLGMSAY